MAAAIGAAAVGAATAIGGAVSGAKGAKKAAKKEEALQRLMTSEELRRLSVEQERVLGSAKAQIAASGFTGYGANTREYLKQIQQEGAKEQMFTRQVGAEKALAMRARGEAVATGYQYQAATSAVEGIAKIGEAFNWGLDETTTSTTS